MELLKAGAAPLGINLTERQLALFETYYRELVAWNERVNLTSIIDYAEVQVKHFLDSLTVASATDLSLPLTLIDVGTGAGLPGLPLKIAFPHLNLVLVEATVKKTRFLEHIIARLELKNVTVVASRSEVAAHEPRYRAQNDIAVARAVAALPALAELLLPFCKTGGCCIVLKKGDISEEISQAEKAITLMGGVLREAKPVTLPQLADNRCLVIIDKVQETPPLYPRRPGLPEKRPLIP